MTAIASFFARSNYNATALADATIPSDTQVQVAQRIASHVDLNPRVAELCCGGAWLSIRLSRLLGGSFVLCDVHRQQLDLASQNVAAARIGPNASFSYVEADSCDTRLPAAAVDLVCISFAIHLFDEASRSLLLREAVRICCKNGVVCILTFSPRHIAQTLLHRYIEGFCDIDARRYVAIRKLEEEAEKAGMRCVSRDEVPYHRTFIDCGDVAAYLGSEPFSTFAILKAECGATEYRRRITHALQRIAADHGTDPVINESCVTLLVFRKE
jgi:ubiquinone/menaquinone biosynthesis C-methylase UbiE